MSEHILLVDDSKTDRKLISMILNKNLEDVIIVESEDGIDVLDQIIELDIKTCILDLRMPQISGYEILSAIKSNPRTMDVPVIVCSGHLDTTGLEKVLLLGAYDYFTKPLSDEAMKISLPLKVKNAVDLMKRTQSIVRMSQMDPLTQLYNRDFFKRYILNRYEKTFPNSILMFDINGLKILNDAFGSEFGDAFLKETAQLIKDRCPEDAISSRWGGDEFAVYIPNCGKKEAEHIASSIRKSFSKLVLSGLSLSLAIGWDTQYNEENELVKSLIKAEDAMIRSKILEDVSVRSNMINGILKTLHEKNNREELHSRRVSELCEKMGLVMQLSEKEVHDLKVIGLLHDIGKIAIDKNILNKPEYLIHEEWLEIKRHPEIGYRILSSSSELQEYADIILCHHERIDGKGYPNGLMGNQIPMFSKIVSIADSYDAMTRERSYKHVLTDEEAVCEFERHLDTQFDAKLVKLFVTEVLCIKRDACKDDV